MNIVLLGAPGSGKGTQAKLLVEKHGLTHINPGAIFREELAAGTELGWKVANALKRGELVSDELATEAVLSRVGTQTTGFLFDGYPRTMEQAVSLDSINLQLPLDVIVYLDAPLEALKERLLNRGRADDLAEVIEERFRWFSEYTLDVVEYYADAKGFVAIDATLPVEEVATKIEEAITKSFKQ